MEFKFKLSDLISEKLFDGISEDKISTAMEIAGAVIAEAIAKDLIAAVDKDTKVTVTDGDADVKIEY